jgi:hypothetical protein
VILEGGPRRALVWLESCAQRVLGGLFGALSAMRPSGRLRWFPAALPPLAVLPSS